MPYLFDQAGRPIDFSSPDHDFEVPHVFTFGSVMAGGQASYFHEHWDEAMRHQRLNGLAMKRDAFILSLLRERRDAVLSCKWSIEPDNKKDPTEKATAEAIGKATRLIRRIRQIKRQLSWATWYGRAGVFVKWGWKYINVPAPVYSGPAEAGMAPTIQHQQVRVWTIIDSYGINGDKIGYTWNGMPYILAGAAQAFVQGWAKRNPYDYMYTSSAPAVLLRKAELRRRVLIHRHDPDDSDYFEPEMAGGRFGVGVRSRLYWSDYMRREYLSWVTDTFDRIGLGLVVIYFDASNAQAHAEALKIAKTYSRRSAICIPMTPDQTWRHGAVQVVEAPISGAQFVLDLVKALEAHMERYVIGQSMSSGAGAGDALGGQGKALLQGDTKHQIIIGDAEDLDETLTGSGDYREPGLVDTMFRFTYPQLYGKFPLFHRTAVDEVDPLVKLQAVLAAAQLGITFKADDVRALVGMAAPDDDDEAVGGQQAMPGAEGGQPGVPGQEDGLGGEPNMEALLGGGGEEPEMPSLTSGRMPAQANGQALKTVPF